jgi:hypothetical protein
MPEQLLIFDWRICHGSAGRCPRSCYPLLELGKSFHYFLRLIESRLNRGANGQTDWAVFSYREKASFQLSCNKTCLKIDK